MRPRLTTHSHVCISRDEHLQLCCSKRLCEWCGRGLPSLVLLHHVAFIQGFIIYHDMMFHDINYRDMTCGDLRCSDLTYRKDLTYCKCIISGYRQLRAQGSRRGGHKFQAAVQTCAHAARTGSSPQHHSPRRSKVIPLASCCICHA